jgi:hypothetical protein
MPGVIVTTGVRGGPSSTVNPASGQFFLVGLFDRGVTDAPVLVRSLPELERNFGGRVAFSDSYDQVATFLSEGGSQVWVQRVVGPAATVGTLTLNDREETPVATLRVDAASPGAWSSGLTVQVQNGAVTDTFRVTVRLNGEIVEDYNNLATPADAVAKFAGSVYVSVTNLGSASVAPSNNPAVLAATALTAGSDDRASVTATVYVTALGLFAPELGDGAVAIPNQTGATVWDGLIAHARANNRIALLSAAKNETVSNLKTAAATMDSEYAGLFAPWVVVPTTGGATRSISPESYVAACRSRAHNAVGPWRAPAGVLAIGNYVVDLDQTFTTVEAEELDASKVSVARKIASTVRLYGWKSLANDTENWLFLKDRDLLNRITVEANKRLEKFVFEPIDPKGQLLSVVNAEIVGFVDPIAKAGGLYARYDNEGFEMDPGYVVNTGSDINPVTSLAQNRISASLAVRVAPTGALINMAITKVGLLGSLA